MISYNTYSLPTQYYYSTFHPDIEFATSEDAIDFEKLIAIKNLPNMIRFYKRKYDESGKIPEESGPWIVDTDDNYQSLGEDQTPGFEEIEYVYSTKKCFIEIEEDEVTYRFFNEETQQYESEIKVNTNEEKATEFYKFVLPSETNEKGETLELEVSDGWFEEISGLTRKDGKGIRIYDVYGNLPTDGVSDNDKFDFFVLRTTFDKDGDETKTHNAGYYTYDSTSNTWTQTDRTKLTYYTLKKFNTYNDVTETSVEEGDYVQIEEDSPYYESLSKYTTSNTTLDGTYLIVPKGTGGTGKWVKFEKQKINDQNNFLPLFPDNGKLYGLDKNLTKEGPYEELYYRLNDTWYIVLDGIIKSEETNPTVHLVTELPIEGNTGDIYYIKGNLTSSDDTWQYYGAVHEAGIYQWNGSSLIKVEKVEDLLYDNNDETKIFKLELTASEAYIASPAIQSDPWYVKFCRSIYKAATWLWNKIKTVGEKISSFFSTLWSWLKGETYYGTEILFYWGVDGTLSTLNDTSDCYYVQEDKKFYIYNKDVEKWVHQNHFEVSKTNQLPGIAATCPPQDPKYVYVIQNGQAYYCENYKYETIPMVRTFNEMIPETNKEKEGIYYIEDKKMCYKLTSSNSWIPAYDYTKLEKLYEEADAIRQILNYKDEVYTTAFKKFNKMIDVLNSQLGFNFPTNVNTVQPIGQKTNYGTSNVLYKDGNNNYWTYNRLKWTQIGDSNYDITNPELEITGDWGFYFYDKAQGWITGKEAHSLDIL